MQDALFDHPEGTVTMNEVRPPVPVACADRPTKGGLAERYVNPGHADGGADFDERRLYRYNLWRIWGRRLRPKLCGWVMLNPSTGDETTLDPTLRRCVGYSRDWGFDGMVVRNLFAWRATAPGELLGVSDPVGQENDVWLTSRWDGVCRVVVAWGAGRHPRIGGRDSRVAGLLAPMRPMCLRVGRYGDPLHPLYQPRGLSPVPWEPAVVNEMRPVAGR